MSDKKIDTGGPAYASQIPEKLDGMIYTSCHSGMTWLDAAAIKMAAIIFDRAGHMRESNCVDSLCLTDDFVAKRAYEVAQALLAEKRRIEEGE